MAYAGTLLAWEALRHTPIGRWPPFLRIDYVWHDQAWSARRAWSGRSPGSDHRYVAADLSLRSSRP